MIDIKLDSILVPMGMLSSIVRAYPAQYDGFDREISCLRPNTFAMLQSMNDLNANNLLKTMNYYGENYFFSRSWEDNGFVEGALSFDYPLVGVAIDNNTIPISGTNDKACYKVNLFVLDQKPSYCKSCDPESYCNTRTIERMGVDLNKMLRNIISQFTDFVFAELIKDGALLNAGWYNNHWLDIQLSSGGIDSVLKHSYISDYISTKVAQAEYFPNAYNDDVGGIFTNIVICLEECIDSNSLDFDYSKLISDPVFGNGCIVC